MSLASLPPAPGPGRRYPLANWLALRRNPLEFLEGLARDYGDVVRFRLGPVFVHLVNENRTNELRVRIPAGSILLLSQWITHRDPRFFLDPLRFDPLRFTPEANSARPKFAYFPFGGGPRVCIGEGFAWMEGVLLLATIARRWRFSRTDGAAVTPAAMITLRPKGGLPMRIEEPVRRSGRPDRDFR